MQAENANGIPVVIIPQPYCFPQDKRLPYINMQKKLAKQLVIFGILQIVFGAVCVISEIVSVAIYDNFYINSLAPVGYGFWIGAMFIVTGPFGIFGGKKRSRCPVIAFNVLSIISASFSAILFSLAVPSALRGNYYYRYFYNISVAAGVSIAMDSTMAFMALAEAIVAIWSSVVCCTIGACCCDCGGDCCCPPSPTMTIAQDAMANMTAQPHPGQPGSAPQLCVMYNGFAQQQPFMIPNQQPLINPVSVGGQPSEVTPTGQIDFRYTRLQS